jgi:hypothetical protein
MTICRATKRNGEPCTLAANGPHGFCWAHDPQNAAKRRRMASHASRARGTHEIIELKSEIRRVIAEVEAGNMDKLVGQVVLQGFRVWKDAIELERRVRETDEVARELEELKQSHGIS